MLGGSNKFTAVTMEDMLSSCIASTRRMAYESKKGMRQKLGSDMKF